MLQELLSFKQQTKTGVQNITPMELQQRLQANEPPLVIDVRTPEEFVTGHIGNSRLLPLSSLSWRSNELPKDKPIVCVCRSGNRSLVACEQLAAMGFTNLFNLGTGMIGWHQANLPMQF